MNKFKIGDKVKFSKGVDCGRLPYEASSIPYEKLVHGQSCVGKKYLVEVTPEIIDIYGEYYIVKYPTDNPKGFTQLGFLERHLDLVEPKVEFNIEYEEPTEDEMDDNCVEGCRPGEHKCDKHKVVLIKLIQIGRGKINEQFSMPMQGKTEQDFAEIALEKCKKYLASNDVELEPDERKGKGFWKLRVGMGYHVGNVEIIL